MKCLGLTKASNFRKRCTRETSFLLCWQHACQPFAAIVAIVVFLSALAEITGFSLRNMLSKAPLVPDITCTMEYPIKAEIVDDHVEVKTAFAVTNLGDAAALVTEDGFEIVKTIEPGQTKYYTKTVNVGRMPGNEQPLENAIKSMDESEVAFEIQFSINYRPANDKEQFLKVTGHYNVGKHKVTEVAKVKKS